MNKVIVYVLSFMCIYVSALTYADEFRSIKVSGECILHVRPDKLEIPIMITGVDSHIEKAKEIATHNYTQLIAKLEPLGIENKDVRISFQGADADKTKDNEKIYIYTYDLRVSVKDFKAINSIIKFPELKKERLITLPILINPTLSFKEARETAVQDAREKAGQLASAANLVLGDIVSIHETSSVISYDNYDLPSDITSIDEFFNERKPISITIGLDVTFGVTPILHHDRKTDM